MESEAPPREIEHGSLEAAFAYHLPVVASKATHTEHTNGIETLGGSPDLPSTDQSEFSKELQRINILLRMSFGWNGG
jgi:hypothetical protein